MTTAAVRKTDNRRERFLSLDEVRRLGQAFDDLATQGVNPKALNIGRLWALTGCRRNEVAGLLWSEVDAERVLLILDDSKTGKSIRPLGAPALTLLSLIPQEADSPFVFPATRGVGFFCGTKDVWPKVTKAAGLPGVIRSVDPHRLKRAVLAATVLH